MRPTRHDRHRCAQNADHFATSSPFSGFFAEVVCDVGTTPPQVTAAPPPSGGNCTTRGSDTPATRRRRASCSANPHRSQHEVRRVAYKAWHSTGWREKVRPARPLRRLFREKVRPARAKTPNLGQFERAGRTFSRFRDLTATQGELFRACRRRPSSALPISNLAPLVWRVLEGPEGPAAAPVDNGARPRCLWTAAGKPRQISHVISLGHFLRPPENVAIPTVRIQCLK